MKKTPITYWGGKQSLLSLILPLIPEHITYCEPFFGGGAVFFAKPPSRVEIINDLNQEVVNFYRQAKTNFKPLQERIQATLHSRRQYKDAVIIYQNPHLFNELDRAWAFYVGTNQGYSGSIGSWGFGTACPSVERKVDNGRVNFVEELQRRLDRVQIESSDALYLLKLRDRDTTFFYLDPPYFNSDCAHYKGYSESDFQGLLQSCANMKGKFLLSSYPSELLTKYTAENGWYQIEVKQVTKASSNRKLKTEVLTANFPLMPLSAHPEG